LLSPLKIYEYAACEKPIITSRLKGLDFIDQINAGIIVKPENLEEIAKAIIELLKNPRLRSAMGKNGRQYVVKNHSWNSVAKKVENVCKMTIKQTK